MEKLVIHRSYILLRDWIIYICSFSLTLHRSMFAYDLAENLTMHL